MKSFLLPLVMILNFGGAAQADVLAEIQKKKVLTAGVKDSLPPFGYIDEASRQIVGYDVDFARALAKKLNVKLELKPVTSANRMPMLTEGSVDILVATMTKNAERAKQVDFSDAYFQVAQRFLMLKGRFKTLQDMEHAKIGTAKGSTSEKNASEALPKATVLSYDDYPQAVLALYQSKVQAVTTDDAILAGLLAKIPTRDKYELSEFGISQESYGIAIKKGESPLVEFVNKTLLEMEKSGEAAQIFEKWFGPQSQAPLKRNFKITPGK
jgi:polar amino acid transport system substrate-binding protein